jgi:KDO2-lipid IV(A) lauroyltransferase
MTMADATAARPAARPRRKRRPKPTWLVHFEYGAVMGFLFVVRRLPLGLVYRLAEGAVRLLYLLPSRQRKASPQSLAVAYGDRSEAERREILRAYLPYHAGFLIDVALGPHLLLDPRHTDAVDLGELDAALSAGSVLKERGALLVGSHQGTADVGSLAAARAGWPHAAVARPLDHPKLGRALLAEREPFGRPDLPKSGALRPAHRLLKKNGIVGMQIDQDAGPRGVFVPYFGRPASTAAGAAMLAVLSGAPVYMFFCLRTALRRFRYKVYCRGPLWAAESGDTDRDVQELTARMTAEIEKMARRYPEQVLWVHRRWKTPPPDEHEV